MIHQFIIALKCHYDANFRQKMAEAVSLYLEADAEIRAQSSRGRRLKRSTSDESSDSWQQGPNSMGTSCVMTDFNVTHLFDKTSY